MGSFVKNESVTETAGSRSAKVLRAMSRHEKWFAVLEEFKRNGKYAPRSENECPCIVCLLNAFWCDSNAAEIDNRALRKDKTGWVYLMGNARNRAVKIGFTLKNPKFREHTLQSQEPEIILISRWRGRRKDESRIHKEFASQRMRGEWFDLSMRQVVGLIQREADPTFTMPEDELRETERALGTKDKF